MAEGDKTYIYGQKVSYGPDGSATLYGGEERTIKAGTSGADEYFLGTEAYAKVQQYKKDFAAAQEQYNTAKAQGADDGVLAQYQAKMDAAHAGAEAIRANAYDISGGGWSGGADGSQYIKTPGSGQTGRTTGSYGGGSSGGGSTGVSIQPATRYGADTDALRSALNQWKTAATQQAEGKIDYAVQTAVANLERALEEAQPQFREQAESVARDERQALDNSALYAELRGDKGGIGQSQYNEIQAQAAKNRLAVQQAQTKLSTDTARQIEDLRAQGEFDKADAALQISQQYLSRLMGLEQWAAEYNLDAAQFEASLQEWEAEYELALKKLQMSASQASQKLQAEMQQNQLSAAQAAAKLQNQNALDYAQLTGTLPDGTLTVSARNQLISMGKALLNAGIMPSDQQLAAMGMTGEQASQYIMTIQLKKGK